MTELNEVRVYHQAYKKALELHRKWDDLEAPELLVLFENFWFLANETLEASGDGWERKKDLKRHLGFMDTNLKAGKKESSKSDIDDLVYADFPAMFDQILRAHS